MIAWDPLTLFAGCEEADQGGVDAPGRGVLGRGPARLRQQPTALCWRSDGRGKGVVWMNKGGGKTISDEVH